MNSYLASTSTTFFFDLNPERIETRDFGTSKYSAKVSMTSLFALFSRGDAMTLTRSWLRPMGSTSRFLEFGFTVIETFTIPLHEEAHSHFHFPGPPPLSLLPSKCHSSEPGERPLKWSRAKRPRHVLTQNERSLDDFVNHVVFSYLVFYPYPDLRSGPCLQNILIFHLH
jgi:hypothetical protein